MRRLLALLLLPVLLAAPVSAASPVDTAEELAEIAGADRLASGLSENERELLGDVSPTERTSFSHGVQELISRAILHGGSYLQEACRTAALVLAVCLLCGLCAAAGAQAALRSVTMAGALGIIAVCFGGIGDLINLGSETVQELAVFSELLLPALSAAAISSGAVTAAPAIYSITVLFTDLLLGCITKVLIPMLYVFLAVSLADCALGGAVLRQFRALAAWLIRGALKTILYAFTAFLTITQVVSGTADAVSAKATKVTISGVVPVVGSIISDASETLLASAAVLKNTIGVFGMLAVLAIVILPFLRIGIAYLVMKLTAAPAGALSCGTITPAVEAVAEALGLLLAMTGACALLLLISAACSLKAVGF